MLAATVEAWPNTLALMASRVNDDAGGARRQCLTYLAYVVGGYVVLDIFNFLIPGGLSLTLVRLCMVVISVALVRAVFFAWSWWRLRRHEGAST